MGSIIKTPNNKANGVDVDFYEGVDFHGPAIATTNWQGWMVYLMSDGDTPEALRGRQFCYRARGVFQPTTSSTYQLSLSYTGKAKFFIDDNLVLDNTNWTQMSGNFMNWAVLKLCRDASGKGSFLRFPSRQCCCSATYSGTRQHPLPPNFRGTTEEADVAILVVGHNNDTEREGSDRISLSLPGRTDELVSAVCAANPKTVVILQSACAISMPRRTKPTPLYTLGISQSMVLHKRK
ncbi:hypothetical protein ACEPPN_014243 [Leptodophora sp. 'Broadleaf-Isolate-01']